MANNQEVLDALSIELAAEHKEQFNAIIKADAKDYRAFRDAVRPISDVRGFDSRTVPTFEVIQQKAAEMRVLAELGALKREELQAIIDAENTEARKLAIANLDAFKGKELALETKLTETAVEAIQQQAQQEIINLNIIEDIKAREAALEKTLTDHEARMLEVHQNLETGGSHLTFALEHLQALEAQRKALKGLLDENNDLLESRDLAEELRAKYDELVETIEVQREFITEEKLAEFIDAQTVTLQEKADGAAAAADRGFDAADGIKAFYTDAKKAFVQVQQAQELAKLAGIKTEEGENIDEKVEAAQTHLNTVSLHYAQPLVDKAQEKIRGATDNIPFRGATISLENLMDDELFNKCRLDDAQNVLVELRTREQEIKAFLDEAAYIARRGDQVFDGKLEDKLTFEEAREEARQQYLALQENIRLFQDKAQAKFGADVDLSGEKAPEAPKKPYEKGVLLMEEEGMFQDFKTEVIRRGQNPRAGLPEPDPNSGSTLVIQAEGEVKKPRYRGVELEEGDVIRSAANFGVAQDERGRTLADPRDPERKTPLYRRALITQDHTGKTTVETQHLLEEQQQKAAFKAAKDFLANYKPGSGAIILRSPTNDAQFANRVYAALLVLKESHPAYKDVPIDSRVPGCTGPGRFERNSSFIEKHLGDAARTSVTKDDREQATKQVHGLAEARYENTENKFKAFFGRYQAAVKGGVEVKEDTTFEVKEDKSYEVKQPR